jgi:uncharacterized membrane protein YhaH (DUF805 family)
MDWVAGPYKRYFDFVGRASRREYWAFAIFSLVVVTITGWIDNVSGLHFVAPAAGADPPGVLTTVFSLVTFVPGLAVAVRRLHDSNRSGWWVMLPVAPFLFVVVVAPFGLMVIFYMFVPLAMLLAAAAFIVLLCLPGTRGPNRFGGDPFEDENVSKIFE